MGNNILASGFHGKPNHSVSLLPTIITPTEFNSAPNLLNLLDHCTLLKYKPAIMDHKKHFSSLYLILITAFLFCIHVGRGMYEVARILENVNPLPTIYSKPNQIHVA